MPDVYGAAALDYWEAGWRGIIPIPPVRVNGKPEPSKFPPLSGWTGYDGKTPSYPDVLEWVEARAGNNIAMRLPDFLVGIDVDAYGDRTGAWTLAEAVKRWGPLPPTVYSTARDDGDSGIRLFRIPQGVRLHDRIKFPEMDLGHIEIVQRHHRYVVCWPSRHPEGGTYRWFNPGGEQRGIPRLSDIAELPAAWIEGLRVSGDLVDRTVDVSVALAAIPDGDMDVAVETVLNKAIGNLTDGMSESRHSITRDNVLRLLRKAEEEYSGVKVALGLLREAYADAVEGDRQGGRTTAYSEYDRMITNQHGHDLIASTPSERSVDRMLNFDVVESHPVLAVVEDRDEETEGEVDDFLEEAFKDSVPPSSPSAPEGTYETYTVDDLARIPPAEPLVDGLLYRNTLAQLTGHPGSYKTFLALALACAVASSVSNWEGYPVKTNGPVIYIAAEGTSGIRTRILAWCEANNRRPDDVRLHVLPEAVQLGSSMQVGKLVATVLHLDAVLVVIDTRARCTAGLEENSATEQGIAIAAADKIRQATDCTVLLVHHSSRAGNAGRGSNSWDGAVWSDLRVESDQLQMTVKCEKHKEVDSGCKHNFTLSRHSVSPELMPGVDPFQRNTLKVESASTGVKSDPESHMQVLRLFREFGGNGGLSRAKAVEFAEGRISSATIYRVVAQLVNKGWLIEEGKGNQTRYKISGHAPQTEEAA